MVCRLTSLPIDGDGPGHHGPIRLVHKPAENCITVLCDRSDGAREIARMAGVGEKTVRGLIRLAEDRRPAGAEVAGQHAGINGGPGRMRRRSRATVTATYRPR